MKKICLAISALICSYITFAQQSMDYSNMKAPDAGYIVSTHNSKLLGFSAVRQTDMTVVLKWNFVESTDNVYTIERATADMKFEPVVSVEQNMNNTYSFIDRQPNPAMNYYRLSVIDKDGVIKYSSIRIIDSRYQMNTLIYPNPATTDFNISMPGQDGMKRIKIFDRFGKPVFELNTAVTSQHIIHSFEKGIYMVQIANTLTGRLENQTLIIQ